MQESKAKLVHKAKEGRKDWSVWPEIKDTKVIWDYAVNKEWLVRWENKASLVHRYAIFERNFFQCVSDCFKKIYFRDQLDHKEFKERLEWQVCTLVRVQMEYSTVTDKNQIF